MNIKYNKALWLIIILAIVMMTPFLGLTDSIPRENLARRWLPTLCWNMATGYCLSTMVATSPTSHLSSLVHRLLQPHRRSRE